jgi:phosphoribosylformylglycinamidine (FGAM) synthase-like enzyme
MWSEHCSYKSTRAHLKKLPTKAPWVIQGPGENAGVVDIGDGDAAIFKMESHNHPSFIEPYQGAATGVGGIMRDVFTMGARPIALLNALRFGDPTHASQDAAPRVGRGARHRRLRQLRRRAHRGRRRPISTGYNGNILVNAMCVGLARRTRSSTRRPRASAIRWSTSAPRPAATASTAPPWRRPSSTRKSEEKRPTVQVGDPFTEKLLIEACLELMATDAIIAIQDMGAAGLTSSSVGDGGQGRRRHRAGPRQGAPARNGHDRPMR